MSQEWNEPGVKWVKSEKPEMKRPRSENWKEEKAEERKDQGVKRPRSEKLWGEKSVEWKDLSEKRGVKMNTF